MGRSGSVVWFPGLRGRGWGVPRVLARETAGLRQPAEGRGPGGGVLRTGLTPPRRHHPEPLASPPLAPRGFPALLLGGSAAPVPPATQPHGCGTHVWGEPGRASSPASPAATHGSPHPCMEPPRQPQGVNLGEPFSHPFSPLAVSTAPARRAAPTIPAPRDAIALGSGISPAPLGVSLQSWPGGLSCSDLGQYCVSCPPP